MSSARISFIIMASLSILVGVASYRFLMLDMKLAFPDFGPHINQRNLVLLAHISSSPIALIIGIWQLSAKQRANHPKLHRWLGRVYGVAILVGGISGLNLALHALGGPVAGWGFSLLAVIWMGITGNAIRLAIAGKYGQHRKWMIRSFALTFAAVTLRLYLIGFMVAGVDYAAASIYIAWACWVPNLIFAEWWIRRGKHRVMTA